MKSNPKIDKVKLTAFALGELSPAERSAIGARLADWDAGLEFVAQVRATAAILKAELRRESSKSETLRWRVAANLAPPVEAIAQVDTKSRRVTGRLEALYHRYALPACTMTAALALTLALALPMLVAQNRKLLSLASNPAPGEMVTKVYPVGDLLQAITSAMPARRLTESDQMMLEAPRLRNFVIAALQRSNQQRQTDIEGAIAELRQSLGAIRQSPLPADLSAPLVRQLEFRIRIYEKDRRSRDVQKIVPPTPPDVVNDVDKRLHMKALMKRYQSAMEVKDYAEGERAALKIQEFAPNDIVGYAAEFNAKLSNRFLNDRSPEGWWRTLHDLEESAMPFPDNMPIGYPDAKKWEELTQRRNSSGEFNVNSNLAIGEIRDDSTRNVWRRAFDFGSVFRNPPSHNGIVGPSPGQPWSWGGPKKEDQTGGYGSLFADRSASANFEGVVREKSVEIENTQRRLSSSISQLAQANLENERRSQGNNPGAPSQSGTNQKLIETRLFNVEEPKVVGGEVTKSRVVRSYLTLTPGDLKETTNLRSPPASKEDIAAASSKAQVPSGHKPALQDNRGLMGQFLTDRDGKRLMRSVKNANDRLPKSGNDGWTQTPVGKVDLDGTTASDALTTKGIPPGSVVGKQTATLRDTARSKSDDGFGLEETLLPQRQRTDGEVWGELTINRQKYQRVDLKERIEANVAMQKALSKPITMNFDKTPLAEVAQFIQDACDINIVLDPNGLHSAAVEADRPITIHVAGMPLKDALPLLLKDLRLTPIVNQEVLLITDGKTADSAKAAQAQAESALMELAGLVGNSVDAAATKSSQIAAGSGNRILAIRQTPAVHARIAQLMADLRHSEPELAVVLARNVAATRSDNAPAKTTPAANAEEIAKAFERKAREVDATRAPLEVEKATLKSSIQVVESMMKRNANINAVANVLIKSRQLNLESTVDDRDRTSTDKGLVPLMLELEGLRETYGKDHPKVKAAEHKLDLMNRLLGSDPTATTDNRSKADRVKAVVLENIEAMKEELKSLEARDLELVTLRDNARKAAERVRDGEVVEKPKTPTQAVESAWNPFEERASEAEKAITKLQAEKAPLKATLQLVENMMKQNADFSAVAKVLIKMGPLNVENALALRAKELNSRDEVSTPLLLELEGLRESYGADHPKVIALKRKLDLMTRLIGSRIETADIKAGDIPSKAERDKAAVVERIEAMKEELRGIEDHENELIQTRDKAKKDAQRFRDGEYEGFFRNAPKKPSSKTPKPQSVAPPVKVAKSWKRSGKLPNASRLLIGETEELPMTGLQVNVRVDGFRARVVLDGYYFNDRDRQFEGNFQLRLPNDASPYFFAFGETVYVAPNGRNNDSTIKPVFFSPDQARTMGTEPAALMASRVGGWDKPHEARMVPREKAAHAYRETVARQVDPALVEWAGAGVFNARVFPLLPGKLHRIVFAYDVDLTPIDGGLEYRLDLPEIDRLDNLSGSDAKDAHSLVVDLSVAKLAGSEISVGPDKTGAATDDRVYYRFDNSSFGNSKSGRTASVRYDKVGPTLLTGVDAEVGPFVAARFRPDLPSESTAGAGAVANKRDGVFLVDVSLSSNPDKFNVWLKLLREILEKNRATMPRFAVEFFNVEQFWWKPGFVDNTPANVEALLAYSNTLALEGASDLNAAFAETLRFATLLNEKRERRADYFILSDGAATWGEVHPYAIVESVRNSIKGNVFAYSTGIAGTDTALLNEIATTTGGALFSVASESEVAKAAIAHRQRPWKLLKTDFAGMNDVLIAGSPRVVYPGQELLVVGRGAATKSPVVTMTVEHAGESRTLTTNFANVLTSELAPRAYGQVAVARLEQFGAKAEEFSKAYATHFRVTGESASLLMLESEADYARFNIKPAEDSLLIKSVPTATIVDRLLAQFGKSIGDAKTRFIAWMNQLPQMPGATIELSTTFKAIVDSMPGESFEVRPDRLVCKVHDWKSLPGKFTEQLAAAELDYDAVAAESIRQLKQFGAADALKTMSSLVERRPGDAVLARDVAFSAQAWGLPGQAYSLLRRVLEGRPFEPHLYSRIANCLVEIDRIDLAIVYFELAWAGKWDQRFGAIHEVVGMEYLHLLRGVEAGRYKSSLRDFAVARVKTVSKELKSDKADLVIVVEWNTDSTDMDLHVVEPTGEECFYSHAKTNLGATLSTDVTRGYGPEMYVLPKAATGKYQISMRCFANDRNRASARTKIYTTIYENFGKPNEKLTRKTVEVTDNSTTAPVAKLQIGK